MYMIGGLGMLKLYETRHPDVNANAYLAYTTMAALIAMSVLGVVYYMGTVRLNIGIFRRVLFACKTDILHWTRPLYVDRMVLLAIANVVNWSFTLYGVIVQPSDFASYLLAIVIVNLLLYAAFYIVMKYIHKEALSVVCVVMWIGSIVGWILSLYFFSKSPYNTVLLHGERISYYVILLILICIICWAAAIAFFFMNISNSMKTAAVSREYNKDCVLFDFYDYHDIWHCLSAISLFTSFVAVLLLDDDLRHKPHHKIPVF